MRRVEKMRKSKPLDLYQNICFLYNMLGYNSSICGIVTIWIQYIFCYYIKNAARNIN